MLFSRSDFARFKGKPRPANTYRAGRRNLILRDHRKYHTVKRGAWHGISRMLREKGAPIHYTIRTYKAMASALRYARLYTGEVLFIFKEHLKYENDRRSRVAERNKKINKLQGLIGKKGLPTNYNKFNTVVGGAGSGAFGKRFRGRGGGRGR